MSDSSLSTYVVTFNLSTINETFNFNDIFLMRHDNSTERKNVYFSPISLQLVVNNNNNNDELLTMYRS